MNEIETKKMDFILKEIDSLRKAREFDSKTVDLLLEAMNSAFFAGFRLGFEEAKKDAK
jgi:uncharacterized membrane protein (Fun14 family)